MASAQHAHIVSAHAACLASAPGKQVHGAALASHGKFPLADPFVRHATIASSRCCCCGMKAHTTRLPGGRSADLASSHVKVLLHEASQLHSNLSIIPQWRPKGTSLHATSLHALHPKAAAWETPELQDHDFFHVSLQVCNIGKNGYTTARGFVARDCDAVREPEVLTL